MNRKQFFLLSLLVVPLFYQSSAQAFSPVSAAKCAAGLALRAALVAGAAYGGAILGVARVMKDHPDPRKSSDPLQAAYDDVNEGIKEGVEAARTALERAYAAAINSYNTDESARNKGSHDGSAVLEIKIQPDESSNVKSGEFPPYLPHELAEGKQHSNDSK